MLRPPPRPPVGADAAVETAAVVVVAAGEAAVVAVAMVGPDGMWIGTLIESLPKKTNVESLGVGTAVFRRKDKPKY